MNDAQKQIIKDADPRLLGPLDQVDRFVPLEVKASKSFEAGLRVTAKDCGRDQLTGRIQQASSMMGYAVLADGSDFVMEDRLEEPAAEVEEPPKLVDTDEPLEL